MITFATTFFKPFFFEAALSVNLTTMLEEEEEEGYTAQPGKVGAPTLGEHSGWAGAPCEPPGTI